MLLFYKLLIIFCIILVLYLWKNIKNYKLHWKLGGPLGLPFLGTVIKLRHKGFVLKALTELEEYYTSPYCNWLGPKMIVILSDPDTMQTVLTSPLCVNKTFFYDFLSEYIGDGLFTSKTPKWNIHTKFMKPAFKQKILSSFISEFNEQADVLVNIFSDNMTNEDFKLFRNIQNMTLNTTLKTVVGDYSSSYIKEIPLIHSTIEKIMEAMIDRIFKPWEYLDAVYKKTYVYKETTKKKQELFRYFDQKIQMKIQEINLRKTLDNDEDDEEPLAAPTSFLEYMLTHRNDLNLNSEEIREESSVLFAAGYETTAVALYITILCLSTNPDIQDKLYNELIAVIPDKNTAITDNILKELIYLEMCMDDSMRVIAPVPLVGRKVTEDIKLKNNIIIHKGTELVLDIFSMQRSVKYWGENAKKFNPENFYPGKKNNHPYSYIPFTKGLRMCIGFKYSKMLMKIFLTKLFRNFKITTDTKFEDLVFVENISIKVRDHPKFKIEYRE